MGPLPADDQRSESIGSPLLGRTNLCGAVSPTIGPEQPIGLGVDD